MELKETIIKEIEKTYEKMIDIEFQKLNFKNLLNKIIDFNTVDFEKKISIRYDYNNDIDFLYTEITLNTMNTKLNKTYRLRKYKKKQDEISSYTEHRTHRINEIALLDVLSELLNTEFFQFTKWTDENDDMNLSHKHLAYSSELNLMIVLHESIKFDD